MVKKPNLWDRIFKFQEPRSETITKIMVQTSPTGVSGTEFQGEDIVEDYLNEMTGVQRAEKFDKMRRQDARVKMNLSAIKNPLRSADWSWTAPKDVEKGDQHAEFLDHVFQNDMAKTWSGTLGDAMSCVDFGAAVLERVHKIVENHPRWGTYNSLASMGLRAMKTIEGWNVDEHGCLLSIHQQSFGDLDVDVNIDAKWLSVISIDKEGDNYEGISLLRPCFGSWLRKQTYLKLTAIGTEKHAIPTAIGTIPKGQENSKAADDFEDALKSYATHQNNYIIKPEGWEIDFESNTFQPDATIKAIDFENKEMTFAFLANFLELAGGGGGGSYALSNDLSDFFLGGIEYIAKTIAEEFDKVGKELIIMNFGEQEAYPKLVANGIADKAGSEFATLMKTFVDGRMITPDDRLESSLRKRLGLPEADEKTQRKATPPAGPASTGDQNTSHLNNTSHLEPNPADNVENQEHLDAEKEKVIAAAELSKRNGASHGGKAGEVLENASRGSVEGSAGVSNRGHDHSDSGSTGGGAGNSNQGGGSIRRGLETGASMLAESKATAQIKISKKKLRPIFERNLAEIGAKLSQRLISEGKKLPDSKKDAAIGRTQLTIPKEFRKELKEALTTISVDAQKQARKEVPGAADVKLTDRETGIKLDDFDKLPTRTQRFLNAQATLLVQTTARDMEKAVMFTYAAATVRNVDDDALEAVLKKSVDDQVSSASVTAAAGNSAGRTVNQSRNSFFSDDEVQKEIESFTFTNPDPVAEICKNLAGKTFSADDGDSRNFMPPLHHNCESFISVNLTGKKNNPDLTPGGLKPSGTTKQVNAALKSVTL